MRARRPCFASILGLVKADGGTVSWNGEIVEQPDRFFIPPRSAYTPQVPPVLDEPHGEPADGSHRSCRGRGCSGRRRGHDTPSDVSGRCPRVSTPWSDPGVRLSGRRSSDRRRPACSCDGPTCWCSTTCPVLDVETERILWERLFRTGQASPASSYPTAALPSSADQIVVMEAGPHRRGRKARRVVSKSRSLRAPGRGGRLRPGCSLPAPRYPKNMTAASGISRARLRDLRIGETGNGNGNESSSVVTPCQRPY